MPERPLVKICGTTSAADARLAAHLGADFLGVIVEHAPSPRSVNLHMAREIFAATSLPTVAVTVNQPLERLLYFVEVLRPAALQLHGDESTQLVRDLKAHDVVVWAVCTGEADVIQHRAQEMVEAGADAVLIDARATGASGVLYGGTGHRSDWNAARQLVEAKRRVILAGGLTPDNVTDAVRAVSPWMLDVVSGVEAVKGIKDESKVQRFIENARNVATQKFYFAKQK